MDINLLLLAYAVGKFTREELEQVLRDIGFHPAIVQILVLKGDYRKSQVDEALAQEPKILCGTGREEG